MKSKTIIETYIGSKDNEPTIETHKEIVKEVPPDLSAVNLLNNTSEALSNKEIEDEATKLKNAFQRGKMQRQILFRAKRIDNGEWVYGTVAYYEDEEDSPVYIVKTGTDDGKNYFPFYEVVPETVGEFTGFLDTNKNKIFEHDIIKGMIHSAWAHEEICCDVEFENGQFESREYSSGLGTGYSTHKVKFNKRVEIIGNIFDNPELLNKTRNGRYYYPNQK